MAIRESTTVRRERLAALISRRGFLRVTEASVLLGVSEVTVRGDLTALESRSMAVRVHGGAMPFAAAVEPSLEQARSRSAESKSAIGMIAASLVDSGQSVILDVGSTALAVAMALIDREELHDVAIITNGLSIALAFEPALARFNVVLTGGTLRPLQHSLVNPGASEFLESVHADLAFIGCNGVDIDSGVTNINYPEAEVKRRMMLSCKRRVLLADASKLGQVHLGVIGTVSDFDVLVTSADSQPAVTERLRALGIDVREAPSARQ
jgi:DeoR family transcriptional regulator, aga operon transcriptional repressor